MKEHADQIEGLSDKQNQAVHLLCAGNTQTEVANQVGVSRMTLWRWLQEPCFWSRYQHVREHSFRNAQVSLDMGTSIAAETLVELARNCENPSVRLAAAKFLIERRTDIRMMRECELGGPM